jgi:SH3-like domain-containing protein
MVIVFIFAGSLRVAAKETEAVTETETVADAEITANSANLVSTVAPELKLRSVTLNNIDMLNDFIGAERLFYRGDFAGKFVVDTEPYLEIYAENSADSEVVGKIYPASVGNVDEWGREWTKISSGNVTGYIATDNIHIGYDAEQAARKIGCCKATVTAESLNIREAADVNSEVVATAVQEEVFTVVESGEEWTHINFGEGEGYVASEFVEETIELDEALTMEEEAAGEVVASKRAEAEAASTTTVASDPVYAGSDELYLLACMVYVESGAEPYEGQLAVANVIVNRVRNPRFSNTIAEVIYAEGQFPGAHNGVLDGVLASGPSESCMLAAQQALAGVNNIGDYYYFNGYVDTSEVSEYLVIGGHTFYNY